VDVVDVLYVSYNAPAYVRRSLRRLLSSCDENTRIWLWHNGGDEETLETVRRFVEDPRVHRFRHSIENVGLVDPTNWLWSQADGDFVSKVDDDCLLPTDWIARLRHAHEKAELGAIGASRLLPEDIRPELVERKIEVHNGVNLMRNHWVQGSGYLLRRRYVERGGPLVDGYGWTNYCLDLARDGAVNGFLYPFVFEDHMDDPRSAYTLLGSDEDLLWRMPLSMKRSKVITLDDWQRQLMRSALDIQSAPIDLRAFQGWRLQLRHLRNRARQLQRA